MKRTVKLMIASILAFIFSFSFLQAQENERKAPFYSYIFDKDSLQGFDEEAARNSAISEGFLGDEFKVRMFRLKRNYINNRYNLWPVKAAVSRPAFNSSAKLMIQPECQNEDFEASTAGSVTAQNQILGWTVTRGDVQPPDDACNLNGCCPNNPIESMIIDAPTGYTDPIIGSFYPIFSVFGSAAGNANGNINNPQITFPMKGNKFIRINSSGLGTQAYSIERLTKTFTVTPNNALFQFAFIFVTSTGHGCCDAAAFQIKLTNATANTVIACPSYSAAGPSSSCLNYTVNNIPFLVTQTGATVNPNSFATVFNKWQISSMDLTQYIGQAITIDVIVSDCTAGGHYGYTYFDAQCGPMVVYGNNTPYGAGSGTINVPTCGASGATLCASAGLGPYMWAGPGVNPPYNTYSQNNNCYITNISGQYTLYMNPPGSCAPIERVIGATITPAPVLLGSVQQAVCGGTTAVVSVTPSGSASSPSSLSWSPTPLSISGNSLNGTYVIPGGPAPLPVTVTAMDNNGCYVSTLLNVNPAPPIPTFSTNYITLSTSITCVNLTVSAAAISNYTYGALSYTWNGTSANYTGQQADITMPGIYTVQACDPVTQCCAPNQTIFIGQNTTPPTSTITPVSQLISCTNTAIQTVTGNATPNNNIQHEFLWSYGGNATSNATTAIVVPGAGTHTYIVTNLLNGCKVTKTFTVATSSGVPTFNLASPVQNFSIGCAPKDVADVIIQNGNTNPPGGTVDYNIYPITFTSTPSFTAANTYTFNQPGNYIAYIRDVVSGCVTKTQFSIIQNTVEPDQVVAIPTQTLTCFTPTILMTGSSSINAPGYQWIYSGGTGTLVSPGPSFTTGVTANETSSTVANYTFQVTDPNNACFSRSVIPIYQNIITPLAKITGPNASAAAAITCGTPAVILQNASTTRVQSPPFPTPGQLIIAREWKGPSPQVDLQNSSTYTAEIPGSYSMTVQDMNNGCYSSTVFTVGDNRDFPVANNPAAAPFATLDCSPNPLASAQVSVYVTSTVNLVYQWFSLISGAYPVRNYQGSAGTPTGVAFENVTDGPGDYYVILTNTVNGCKIQVPTEVVNGALYSRFNTTDTSGFAPHTVTFNNASTSSLGSSSITSVWNFGNGSTQTVSANSYSLPVTQVYNQPGNYTVTLYVSKGQCFDAKTQVIHVEVPSKLEVPNVFTPNGDGSNDLFFVRMSSLTEINFKVYDRWGNLVYEVLNSKNGNVEWDGTNLYGKECAEGTYYYTVTATGKDGKAYDTKGTISLFR